MPCFRILHLSDLHVARKGLSHLISEFDVKVLRVVARFAYHWRNDLQAVFITGDLAQTGQPDDISLAKDFVCLAPGPADAPWQVERPGLHWPTLGATGLPVWLLPGNHDRFQNQVTGLPGNGYFDSVFEQHWRAGVEGVQRFQLPDQTTPQLTILAADFSLVRPSDATRPLGHLGQGKVYEERLHKLVAETKKVKQQHTKSALVWMVHFALELSKEFRGRTKAPDTYALLGGRDLLREAVVLGVEHIFCGHTHYMGNYRTKTAPSVMIHCAGSSACISRNTTPTMHVFDIVVGEGLVQQVRRLDWVWNAGDTTFRRAS